MSDAYTRKRKPSRTAVEDDTCEDVQGAPTLVEVPISAKSLKPVQQNRVREAVVELDKSYVNQTELAEKLGVTQQTVSRIIGGGTIGVKVAIAAAALRGQSLEELLSGAPRPRTYADVEGWTEAAEAALEQGLARRYVLRSLAIWPASLQIARVEVHFIVDLVALWLKWTPRETRVALETAEAVKDLAAENVRKNEVKPQSPRRGQTKS